MRRTTFILGSLILLAALFLWNATIGHSSVGMTEAGQLVEIHSKGPHLGRLAYFVSVGILYGLCWVHFVNEWNRRPVMRFGKYIRTMGAGIGFAEPLTTRTLPDVSVQDEVLEVPVEDLQTKDNVGIGIKGLITYRVLETGVKDSVVKVANVHEAVHERALSTLTDGAAREELDHLLENRAAFCDTIKKLLAERVKPWGVEIEAFELKDFVINDEKVAEAIAMKARARKEGGAEVERASFQLQVAQKLNEAAATYTSEGWRLKGLDVLGDLCKSGNNNTILLPTDMVESLARVAPIGLFGPRQASSPEPEHAEGDEPVSAPTP